MSETYKVIRRAKELFLQEKSKGKVNKKIYDSVGITYNLFSEIMEFDPVSVGIREPSIEKLKAYIERMDNPKPEPKGITDPPKIPDPPPPPVKKRSSPAVQEKDLLAELDTLIIKFNRRGYCLDVTIRKMLIDYKPSNV